uniref:RRM domain-containing protein n=1 Tax=Octopus bimaculoides TaxID=37653 RepID=A0A0L8G748_OCTBM
MVEENLPSAFWVRTLFVSGLPMDAKPRELYLLFRAYKGYQNALLKVMGKPGKNCGYEGSLLKVTNKNGKNTSPVGFVTFNSRVEAEAAKQDLQGVKFDPDLPQTLRLEFAKSNTKVTKPKQQSPQPAATHPTIIHPLTGQELGAAFFPGSPEAWTPHPLAYPELAPATATAIHHAALIQHPALAQVNPNYQKILVPENTHRINTSLSDTGYPKYIGSMIPNQIHPTSMIAHPSTVQATVPHPQIAATPILTSPVGTNSTTPSQPNAPCSTLFVANLGQFSSEQELKDLFSSFPVGKNPDTTRHTFAAAVSNSGFSARHTERRNVCVCICVCVCMYTMSEDYITCACLCILVSKLTGAFLCPQQIFIASFHTFFIRQLFLGCSILHAAKHFVSYYLLLFATLYVKSKHCMAKTNSNWSLECVFYCCCSSFLGLWLDALPKINHFTEWTECFFSGTSTSEVSIGMLFTVGCPFKCPPLHSVDLMHFMWHQHWQGHQVTCKRRGFERGESGIGGGDFVPGCESFPGFCRLRMHNKGGSPVAFVEFQPHLQPRRTNSHTHAHTQQRIADNIDLFADEVFQCPNVKLLKKLLPMLYRKQRRGSLATFATRTSIIMKMLKKENDVRQATEAMNRLHGFVLLSSDRGGIRIEYAKNKMGEVLMPSVCWMKPVTSTTSIEAHVYLCEFEVCVNKLKLVFHKCIITTYIAYTYYLNIQLHKYYYGMLYIKQFQKTYVYHIARIFKYYLIYVHFHYFLCMVTSVSTRGNVAVWVRLQHQGKEIPRDSSAEVSSNVFQLACCTDKQSFTVTSTRKEDVPATGQSPVQAAAY